MARLGISVTRTTLRAVLLRGARVVWHGGADLGSDESMREVLDRLLATVPTRRWVPLRVTVAIGSAHNQLKRIEGLPPLKRLKHRRLMSRIVRENTTSFFLRLGPHLVVSDVEHRTDATTWAAAFDADAVDEVITSLKKRGLARASILPDVVALAPLLQPGEHRLVEDGIALDVTTSGTGRVEHVRRVACDAVASDSSITARTLPSVAEAIECVDSSYLSAYGAATAASHSPFACRPEPDAQRVQLVARSRVIAASVLLLAAAIVAVAAPGIRAMQTTSAASAEMATTQRPRTDAARVESMVRSVSGTLDRIARFRAARGQMTLLLGAISQALPESTAMLSLRVDTLDGSFVALAPHAADILSQLAAVDRITNARIVGSVTRESQGQARVERVTIRFRRQRDLSRASRVSRNTGVRQSGKGQ